MKTLNESFKNSPQKVVFLSLICLFLSLLSCQTGHFKSDQALNVKFRIKHARSLLNIDYDKLKIAQFETDHSFDSYLKKYITGMKTEMDADQLVSELMFQSRNYNYDPVFLVAVIKTESQFNAKAVGTSGEIGLMQIKPSTAEWLCGKEKITWRGAEALKDPSYNIQLGAKYFNYLKKALKTPPAPQYINAYNMGINNLQRLPASNRIFHPYYHRVMRNYVQIYEELKKIKENEKKS